MISIATLYRETWCSKLFLSGVTGARGGGAIADAVTGTRSGGAVARAVAGTRHATRHGKRILCIDGVGHNLRQIQGRDRRCGGGCGSRRQLVTTGTGNVGCVEEMVERSETAFTDIGLGGISHRTRIRSVGSADSQIATFALNVQNRLSYHEGEDAALFPRTFDEIV